MLCAWLEAERPVCSRMALLRSAFSVPQVSYAISKFCSTPPQSRRIGASEWKIKCFPDVYEGSGPMACECRCRLTVFASWASRHGKESAGLVESDEEFQVSSVGRTAAAAAAAACASRMCCVCKDLLLGVGYAVLAPRQRAGSHCCS